MKKFESRAAAKEGLVKEYKFTEPQSISIVSMRLGILSNLKKLNLMRKELN